MLTEPTSLNRGEGLVTGAPGAVAGSVGMSEGGGGKVVGMNESEILLLMELMEN